MLVAQAQKARARSLRVAQPSAAAVIANFTAKLIAIRGSLTKVTKPVQRRPCFAIMARCQDGGIDLREHYRHGDGNITIEDRFSITGAVDLPALPRH